MLRLPLLERLAVNDLAALVLGHRHALGIGGVLHPVGKAIAAEAGEIHHVDVLHVGAAAQMLDEAAIDGGFKLGLGLVVHGQAPCAAVKIFPRRALAIAQKEARRGPGGTRRATATWPSPSVSPAPSSPGPASSADGEAACRYS